jgi:hypothetical protein
MNGTNRLPFVYRPSEHEARVEAICRRWIDVPFKEEGLDHEGIDCERFAAKVWDELLGTDLAGQIRSTSQMDGLNRGWIGGCKSFLRLYRPERGRSLEVGPGDLIVCGPVRLHPGHTLVVGAGVLWHASQPRVSFSGFAVDSKLKSFGIYRFPHARS